MLTGTHGAIVAIEQQEKRELETYFPNLMTTDLFLLYHRRITRGYPVQPLLNTVWNQSKLKHLKTFLQVPNSTASFTQLLPLTCKSELQFCFQLVASCALLASSFSSVPWIFSKGGSPFHIMGLVQVLFLRTCQWLRTSLRHGFIHRCFFLTLWCSLTTTVLKKPQKLLSVFLQETLGFLHTQLHLATSWGSSCFISVATSWTSGTDLFPQVLVAHGYYGICWSPWNTEEPEWLTVPQTLFSIRSCSIKLQAHLCLRGGNR